MIRNLFVFSSSSSKRLNAFRTKAGERSLELSYISINNLFNHKPGKIYYHWEE